MSITLNMIVRNEEALLPACLKSVKDWVDEIIIVDTGSTDGTVREAEAYGARVEHFEWCDDFSAARNYALSFIRTPWTLWLDADDLVLNPEIIPVVIKEAEKQHLDSIWSIYRQDASCYQRRLSLFKTENYRWDGIVHESPQPINFNQSSSFLSSLEILHRKPPERSPQAALKYLNILLTKDPDNWIGLAESYKFLSVHPDDPAKRQQYLQKADENFYKAFKWEHTNDQTKYTCLFNMAWINLELAAYDPKFSLMAKRLAQLGVGTAPFRSECWVVLGQANEVEGDISTAAQCYHQALQLAPPTDDIGLVYQQYYKEIPARLLSAAKEKIAEKQALETKSKDVDIWVPS